MLKKLSIIVFILSMFSLQSQEPLDFNNLKSQTEFHWGVEAFHRGYFNEAIFAFEKALALKADNVLAREWLGYSYYRSGFELAAMKEWRILLENSQASPGLINFYSIIEQRRGLDYEMYQADSFLETQSLSGVLKEDDKDHIIFRKPSSLFPLDDGSVLLTSFSDNAAFRIDANGNLKEKYHGGIEGFDHPFDIITLGDGFLLTEYYADRLSLTDSSGNKIKKIGSRGRGPGELLGPQYLADDNKGYFYVSEWGNSRISRFDYEGNFIQSFSDGLREPTGLAVYEDRILVADQYYQAIAMYDRSGNFMDYLLKGELDIPEGLFIHRGNLIIADSYRVLSLNLTSGELNVLLDLKKEGTVKITRAVFNSNENLMLTDFNNSKVRIASEVSALYSGLFTRIDKISTVNFPEITLDLTVEDNLGRPLVGLSENNFIIVEQNQLIRDKKLKFAAYKSPASDICFIVEQTDSLKTFLPEIDRTGREILGSLDEGTFQLVTAGDEPVVLASPGASWLETMKTLDKMDSWGSSWTPDKALKLGASGLISSRHRKAVILFSRGDFSPDVFRTYGLIELSHYFNNNNVQFYVVYLGAGKRNEDLEFLCRETGGFSSFTQRTDGLTGIADNILKNKNGQYTLSYQTGANIDFGRSFVPVDVESRYFKKTGRAESGFYGPGEL